MMRWGHVLEACDLGQGGFPEEVMTEPRSQKLGVGRKPQGHFVQPLSNLHVKPA